MELIALAQEYARTAALLRERLGVLRALLHGAAADDRLPLERRIALLYAELEDTRVVMHYLRDYYA